MARRRSRRRSSFRSRRSFGRSSFRRSGRPLRGRSRSRRSSGGRTVRIVIEQPLSQRLAPGMSPDGQMFVTGPGPRKARF